MKYVLPRRFHLERKEDVSGSSGTGVVAQGCQFANGQAVMTWLTPLTSVCVYHSLDVLEQIHGHEGKTVVVSDEFDNPVPVVVVLLPALAPSGETGLVLVKRAIEPKVGHWCLPCGYMDKGEQWRETAARELHEETDIEYAPSDFDLFAAETAKDLNRLLLFAVTPKLLTTMPSFHPNKEVSARVVRPLDQKFDDLAFPLHVKMANQYAHRP